MMSTKEFLGTGWSFPPTFEKGGGGVITVKEELDIEQSLEIILSTEPGERVMRPDFGCNMQHMVFEPLNTSLITYMRDRIEKAILYHEPRIDLKRVEINTANAFEGVVLIEIDYTIRTTNSRQNFVYPYYINEGTDIKK
jgi:phage baseplate assembly protein W